MSDTNIPLPPTSLPFAAGEVKVLSGLAADTALAELARLKSEEAIIEFTPFPEGGYFKYGPHKGHPPQCIVVDAAKTSLCIARNADVADFICNSCNALVLASLFNKVQDEKIVQPGSQIIVPNGTASPDTGVIPTVYES